jgi:hypothetical protein
MTRPFRGLRNRAILDEARATVKRVDALVKESEREKEHLFETDPLGYHDKYIAPLQPKDTAPRFTERSHFQSDSFSKEELLDGVSGALALATAEVEKTIAEVRAEFEQQLTELRGQVRELRTEIRRGIVQGARQYVRR